MRAFTVPEVTVVRFGKSDVIATSLCTCVECTVCPEGSNDCPCVDSWSSDYGKTN